MGGTKLSNSRGPTWARRVFGVAAASALALPIMAAALSGVPAAAVPSANLAGTIYQSNGTAAAHSQVNACQTGHPDCVGSSSTTTGHYQLTLSPGSWTVIADPPTSDDVDAPTSVTVTVNTSGVVTKCAGAGCGGTLRPSTSTFRWPISAGPSTSPTAHRRRTPRSPPCQSDQPNCQNVNTDSSGHYGFDVSPGTWNVNANAPSGDSADTSTSVTVTVNTSGVVTTCTGAGCGATLPTVDIHLQKANLSGTV